MKDKAKKKSSSKSGDSIEDNKEILEDIDTDHQENDDGLIEESLELSLEDKLESVSYTHLTLPTILLV